MAEPLTPERIARMDRDARQVQDVFPSGSTVWRVAHDVLALVAEVRRLGQEQHPEAGPDRAARRARRAEVRRTMEYSPGPGEDRGGEEGGCDGR